MKYIITYFVFLFPILTFGQTKNNSTTIINESDTSQTISKQLDTLKSDSEIETTINYNAKDSIYYDLKINKYKKYLTSIDIDNLNPHW